MGSEAAGHLELDLRHPDRPLTGVVGEADVWVGHEAQDGLLVLDAAFVQVVGIQFRHCAAPALWAQRDGGQLLAALSQDGPVALADGPTRGRGQGFGCACVDLVTGLAQQRRHPSCPAVAVGLDDTGQFPEKVGTTQLVPTPVVGEVCRPAVVDPDTGGAGDDTDRIDCLPAAFPVEKFQGQGPVSEDMEPLGLATNPQAGLVGMPGRAVQKLRDGRVLPWLQGRMQALDEAETGRLGQPETGDRLHQSHGPVQREHLGNQQVGHEGPAGCRENAPWSGPGRRGHP